jgi:hypothetical protein
MSIEMDAWQEKYADLAPGQRAWYWHCPPEGIQGLSDNTRIAYQVTRAQDGALWVQVGELPLPVLAGFPCGERCWEAAEVAALRHKIRDLHAEWREMRDRVRALSAWLDGVEVALRTNDRTTAEEEPPVETVAMRVAAALRDAYLRGRYDESYTASIGSMGRLK